MVKRNKTVKALRNPLNYRAVILDPIHKFINVNNLEYFLLQTPFLNRLHKIKQLGFAYLIFPSAKHSRFEHSLGVMHLAGRIAERLLQKGTDIILSKKGRKGERFFIESARLAGLLHDLGHLPYSHNLEEPLERAYESPEDFNLKLSNVDIKYFTNKRLHEITTKFFMEELIRNVDELEGGISSDLLRVAKGSLFNERVPSDILNELGLNEEATQIISQIISHKIIDADRLDYLLRDAHATGVLFGYIDIERLIENLHVETAEVGAVISLDPKGIPAVEDAYDARFKMYRSVYFHHKNIALTLALTKLLPHLFENWPELASHIFGECLTYPEDLYDLRHLASCISEEKILLTDSEFETLLLLASRNKGLLGRWSKPLLLERDLIPISLIKRPDVLVSKVLAKASFAGLKSPLSNDLLIKAFMNFYSYSQDSIERKIHSELTLSVENVSVEVLIRQIIDSTEEEMLPGGYPSLYFKNLLDSGRTPLLYIYVYSDNENVHRKLLHKADELRTLIEEHVINTIILELKRLASQ